MNQTLEVAIMNMIRVGKGIYITEPVSLIYGFVVRIRNWLYDHRLLKQKRAALPVVSVGNLIMGGSGKTQVVILLAKALKNVAILSRGFRSKGEKERKPILVKSHTPFECGDEPRMMADKLPHANIIVNKNRHLSSIMAHELGSKIIILDDGMQHRKLFRDVEIVVIGGQNPLGLNYFFPRGFLRDDPKQVRRADLIVFVGDPQSGEEKRINGLTSAPCVFMDVCVKRIYLLQDETTLNINGAKIGIFCAIGNPGRFVTTVKEQGAEIVAKKHIPDHMPIGSAELGKFISLCKERGAKYILCTEKDRVKLPSNAYESEIPIGCVEVSLEIKKNGSEWEKMINKLKVLGV